MSEFMLKLIGDHIDITNIVTIETTSTAPITGHIVDTVGDAFVIAPDDPHGWLSASTGS
ncbi:MAG: hypothetical protein OXF41_21730 [bacterium]|nr:hypothetical protein [bacterium]